MRTSARRRLAALAATVLVIAGCSSAGRGASETTTPPVETSTAVSTEGVPQSSTSPQPASSTTTTDLARTTIAPLATTTTALPLSSPEALADWPVNPNGSRLRAPTYLPTNAIPDTTDTIRFTADIGDGQTVAYVQQWADAATGAYFAIETLIPFVPNTPTEFRTDVDTSAWSTRWTEAFLARTGPGFVNLQLYDGDTIGLVRLRSLNLDEAVVLDAAATMRRAGPGQPGWIVSSIPDGLVPIIEGDANNAQVRGITWSNGPGRPEADLRITTVPDDLQIEWIAESDAESAVIDGHPGVLTVDGSTVTVRWSPEPGVLVIAARNGTVDETLTFARSVTAADQAAWDAFAVEAFGDYLIQCTGLFC